MQSMVEGHEYRREGVPSVIVALNAGHHPMFPDSSDVGAVALGNMINAQGVGALRQRMPTCPPARMLGSAAPNCSCLPLPACRMTAWAPTSLRRLPRFCAGHPGARCSASTACCCAA